MMTNNKVDKKIVKITKLNLVIYCLIEVICFIILTTLTFTLNNKTILYAFLLCILPGAFYITSSLFLPKLIGEFKSKKKSIVVASFLFSIKYILLIAIMVVGVLFDQYFNR